MYIFSNGRYQILRGPTEISLMDVVDQYDIESSVLKYKEIEPFVYVIRDGCLLLVER
jgi:hypothetical protein